MHLPKKAGVLSQQSECHADVCVAAIDRSREYQLSSLNEATAQRLSEMAAPLAFVPIMASTDPNDPIIDQAQDPIVVPANHPLVVKTPFLFWHPASPGPGGVAQVYLPQWSMLGVFGVPLTASQAPADLEASRKATPLRV